MLKGTDVKGRIQPSTKFYVYAISVKFDQEALQLLRSQIRFLSLGIINPNYFLVPAGVHRFVHNFLDRLNVCRQSQNHKTTAMLFVADTVRADTF